MNFSEYLRESSLSPNREIINRLKESLSGIIASEKIDVGSFIKNFEGEFGKNLVGFINLRALAIKIKNILELGRPNWVKFITKEFSQYISEVEQILGDYLEDEDYLGGQNFDIEEGESSLIKSSIYWTEMQKLQDEIIKLQCWVMGGKRILTSQANEEYQRKIANWKSSQINQNPGQGTRERFLREVDHLDKTPIFKFQQVPNAKKKKVVIVFEGRDGAGKGSSIKRFFDFNMSNCMRVVDRLPIPTSEERKNWFDRYEKFFPREGEIVMFDRSWYNRAVVEPVNGYCTEEEYNIFMEGVNNWESSMIDQGITIIKLWFSITQEKQIERFLFRQTSPYKFWKFSPNDARVVDKYDLITKYKIQMFNTTSTRKCPWVTINSNDKKLARLNAIKYVLSKFNYYDKLEDRLDWRSQIVTVLI